MMIVKVKIVLPVQTMKMTKTKMPVIVTVEGNCVMNTVAVIVVVGRYKKRLKLKTNSKRCSILCVCIERQLVVVVVVVIAAKNHNNNNKRPRLQQHSNVKAMEELEKSMLSLN